MPARKPASADASATGTGTPPPPLRPKGRPRGFRRDRDCRTCKARNVKCDLNRPSCGICVEAGVTCQGYATTVRWANSTPSLPAGASSSSTSSARKSAAAAASVSSFSASPSCGPSPSPSLSHSSVPSPPDTIPNAYHNQQQQQQQLPLPSLDNSGSLMGNFISSLPGHPRSHGHSHSHPGAASAKFHNSTTTTMTTTTTTTPPLQVMPDQRARLLQAALEENPADSNWTTHYLKYYEFFTAQFAQARRAATKERRYRPDMVMISSSPDPDRQPLPPHLQEQQQPLLPQQQPCPVVDGDLKNVWLLLYQRISGQSAVADNNMDLLTSKAGALAEVKEAIRAGDILAIYGVVTLSFLDVYEGPFIDCQWHMLGAKALLQLHCHDLASLDALCAELPGLREAISLLSWYDTMGFYFEQDRRNALVFPDWVREAMHDDFFKLTSCPRDTYMVYAAVVKARTAHRGNREDGDVTPSPLILTSAESGLTGSPATGAIVGCPKVHQQQQRDTKLTMLGIQQILQTSHSKHGQDFLDQTSILNDCFRYAVALIAIETAYTTGDDGSSTAVDSETAATLAALTDRVCDKVLAGVPVNSGRYRHLACQVTILGHHARTQRHRDAVGGYWTRCDTLARPIYPNGRVISSVEEHWTRVLGTSKPS